MKRATGGLLAAALIPAAMGPAPARPADALEACQIAVARRGEIVLLAADITARPGTSGNWRLEARIVDAGGNRSQSVQTGQFAVAPGRSHQRVGSVVLRAGVGARLDAIVTATSQNRSITCTATL